MRVAVAAKTCNTVSPVPWPSWSLIDLKRSRSNRNTASGSKSLALLHQQAVGAIEEGAAVGHPAQRIDQRGDLVLQFGALLGHVEQQERQHHREQQRAERQQRERDPAQSAIALASVGDSSVAGMRASSAAA